jgi:tetratricopeptide (TPR) repeat protein
VSVRRVLPVLSLLALCTAPAAVWAGPDAVDPAKRQQAAELFARGDRLEALPLLEELVRADPKDDELLVELAASLVEHAATLGDDGAAGKERLRARDLLGKAIELGNTSPLAMNLSQILQQLPASGAIRFSDDSRVEQAMRAGEAAFSRRDFAGAIRNYAIALELEPANYSAALFTANAYDRQNEFAKGAEWYRRAIRIDSDVETAYRYYADMLAREGAMSQARTMLILAAVAEPYNRIVWRELHAWATLADTRIKLVYVGVPAEPSPAADAQVWRAYRSVRADWRQGDRFRKRFPGEKEYRHSLPEESEALTAAAEALERIKEGKDATTFLAKNEALRLLLDLHQADLIEPYVLFSLGDTGIARDYAAYRARSRGKLEAYLDKFVVPTLR